MDPVNPDKVYAASKVS